jgi:hypothetical protein
MNDSQLQENYFYACLKYAVDNGGVTDYSIFVPDQCTLIANESNEISIQTWTHSSTQPTNTDLKLYQISDLDEVKDLYLEMILAKEGKIFVTSTAHATLVKPYCQEGHLYYDQDTSSLKILIGNTWTSI